MTNAHVLEIYRYPIKSMIGEAVDAAVVTERGVLGDRALALVDEETGKAASAKNPRRWPNLFDFRAAYVSPPKADLPLPAIRITLPGGEPLLSDHSDAAAKLSAAVGRPVRLGASAAPAAEGYWPQYDWLNQPDSLFEYEMPAGTLFDGAVIHLLTTATLARLKAVAPDSRFEAARFRPNFVIDVPGSAAFVENDWIGRTFSIGAVLLRIDGPCPRCVMTTLAQQDLPKDPFILKTAVQHNGGNVGVYAHVVQPGIVSRGEKASISGLH